MAVPVLVRAPAKMSATTCFCCAVRQVPSRVLLQVGTSSARLKAFWQAAVSLTMPSAALSSASHLARMRLATSVRSAAVKAVDKSGVVALAVAALAYCWAPQICDTAALGRL
jgi:hypothetical protein